ncbi:MAG TPA: NAD-dependent deacylase [Anaerolineales bacterium]|nr:NAD-dependent deacylase [Anaerolineales bacterium]
MEQVSTELRQDLLAAASLLRSAKKGVALTGAGISTPSGIPDFRSAGSGLWTRFDPFEVASLSAFRYRPEKFYAWMRSLAIEIVQARPNPAHLALASLEQVGLIQMVITQNIDSLHQRAGSLHVLEIHGTLQSLTCIGCYHRYGASGFLEPYLETGQIPRCPDCYQILKPDVVLFEEQLPVRAWLQAQQACESCDLLLVAGSSLEVMPVAGLPLRALEHGSHLILVNQSPTYLDERADFIFNEDVAVVLPHLVAEVQHG